jgi:GAF domain-containing protein
MTGMRFAAVARVTEDRWIACSVRDDINFGLKPGGELKVETTLCHEIRQSGEAVIIDHVAEDPVYACHHTPQTYGLQSYISMPIRLADGSFFGTLCAIDPEPHRLKAPETVQMFEMFADVIGFQLSAIIRMDVAEANLLDLQNASALREQFIAVLGHDLRNPLASISGGVSLLRKETLSDRGAKILNMMHGSDVRMSGLIDNVLDFARGRLGGGLTLTGQASVALEPIFATGGQ